MTAKYIVPIQGEHETGVFFSDQHLNKRAWRGIIYETLTSSDTPNRLKYWAGSHQFLDEDENEVLLIDDAGHVHLETLHFTGGAGTQGTMSWNADEETVDLICDGATLQLGQESYMHVRNNTALPMTEGQVIMATGTLGASGRILVQLMVGSIPANAKYLVGVVTEPIAAGADGKITTYGKVRQLDTSGTPFGEVWADGDVLWVSPVNDGELTNVEPTATQMGMPIAIIIKAHGSAGTLFVRLSSLDEHRLLADHAFLPEQSAADTSVAGWGQIWIKDDTPNTVYFTDDAGTDHNLSAGAAFSELVYDLTPQLGGDLDLNGFDITGSGNILITETGATDRKIEVGVGRTVNGASWLDLIADSTNTDYGLRIKRFGGVNGHSYIATKGTGALIFQVEDDGGWQVVINGQQLLDCWDTGFWVGQEGYFDLGMEIEEHLQVGPGTRGVETVLFSQNTAAVADATLVVESKIAVGAYAKMLLENRQSGAGALELYQDSFGGAAIINNHANASLQLVATGATGMVRLITNSVERVRVDGTGHVKVYQDLEVAGSLSIGIAAPSSKLHVDNPSGSAVALIEHSGSTFAWMYLADGSTTNYTTVGVGCYIDQLLLKANNTYIMTATSALVSIPPALRVDVNLKIKERAAADTDNTGYGQIWVKNTVPCELWYTGDTGVDVQLGVGGGDLVDDLTPELGGTLDALTNDIINVGDLGIGVAAPARPLHIQAADRYLGLIENDTGFYAYLYMMDAFSTSNTHVGVGAAGDALILRASGADIFVIESGYASFDAPLDITGGSLFIKETAAASSSPISKGQIWVKNTTPNQLWFTDDAGNDTRLYKTELYDDTTPVLYADLNCNYKNLDNLYSAYLYERASASADISGRGQIWVKNTTPNQLWFTDDSGIDVQLGAGGGGPTDSLFLDEQSAAQADVAGDGQFWVRDDAPNVPMFTDDVGTDFNLIGEEGTFTPTLQDTSYSDAEGQTYYNQNGYYTKIGKMVYFAIRLRVNSLGTLTTSSSVFIGNLPFTSAASIYWAVHCGYGSSLGKTSSQAAICGYIAPSTSRITLNLWDVTSGTSPMTVYEVSSNGDMMLSGHYRTA